MDAKNKQIMKTTNIKLVNFNDTTITCKLINNQSF